MTTTRRGGAGERDERNDARSRRDERNDARSRRDELSHGRSGSARRRGHRRARPLGTSSSASRGGSTARGQDMLQHAISEVTHERRPRRLALRYGVAWLAGYAIVAGVVVVLAFMAHTFSVLPGDVGIARELQENRNPLVFASMVAISWLGYEPQVTIIFVLAVLALWLVRLRLEAVFLICSELADLIAEIVKIAVARSRPSAKLVDVVTHLSSYSFPSGHTVHYTVFYGFLGFVIATNFRPHWVRQVCLAICIGLIVLVGPSRVYLGEHWPTDVLAGYLIGALFLIPFIGVYLWAKEHVAVVTYWPFFEWRHPSSTRRASARPS